VPTFDAETDIGNHFRLGPDKVVIVEKWETLAHLKAHAVAPHMQAYRPKVKDFVKGMELRILTPA
jgi:quinol monooxygenase YgiN